MTITQERSAAEIDGLTDGDAVARAEGLCKVYGTGDAQVVALDHVTVEFGRADSLRSWALRVRQVHADALHGRPGRPDVRTGGHRRHRHPAASRTRR